MPGEARSNYIELLTAEDKMIHQTIVVGPLECNCALLACEKTKEAIIIDPGEQADKIIAAVEKAGLSVKYLVHTHAHFDHIGGTKGVREVLPAAICLHRADEQIYQNLPLQGKMFGFAFDAAPPVEKWIEDEETLLFGECRATVIHTPGHSPGSICLRVRDEKEEKLFSGDTLFQMSIGRSDLWGGDQSQLLKSVRERIFTLDGEMPVYPGHGASTRIGDEKLHNPFFR